jgi:hypothetical protein
MTSLLKFFKRHWSLLLPALLAIPLFFYAYGCESTCRSMLDPLRSVTRPELQAELTYLLSTAEARFGELDRKDAAKSAIFDELLITAETGTVNPLGVIAALLGALGVTSAINNATLRAKINNNAKKAPKTS